MCFLPLIVVLTKAAAADEQAAHSTGSDPLSGGSSCAWFSWWGVVAVAAASTLLLHVLLDRLPDCFTLGAFAVCCHAGHKTCVPEVGFVCFSVLGMPDVLNYCGLTLRL